MMDPLPQIRKVFALNIQEERQRLIQYGLLPTAEPLSSGTDLLSDGSISAILFSR